MRLFTERRLTFGVLCVALVIIYLTWWITYAESSQGDHYRRLAPGATFESDAGTARLLSLQAADELTDSEGGKPAPADDRAVWVVATMEVVVHEVTNRTWCDLELVSTTRQVWPLGGASVERALPRCRDDEMVLGQPYRYEAVFLTPASQVDAIAGVALRDTTSRRRVPILSPPG